MRAHSWWRARLFTFGARAHVGKRRCARFVLRLRTNLAALIAAAVCHRCRFPPPNARANELRAPRGPKRPKSSTRPQLNGCGDVAANRKSARKAAKAREFRRDGRIRAQALPLSGDWVTLRPDAKRKH